MTLPVNDPPGERPKADWLEDTAPRATSTTGFRVEPRSVVPVRTVVAPRTEVAPRTGIGPRTPSEERPPA